MTAPAGTRVVEFQVPGMLATSVAAWLSAGQPGGGAPKLSSTVMLLRDRRAAEPVEVFMLRRVTSMKFAPSMWVFPGGGVDPRDAEIDIPWAGPRPQEWADRMRAPAERAVELVVAAVREVFEECGVLLAGADGTSVVADVSGPEWRAERDALLSKEQSFGQLLARRGLVLRSDLLSLRDHWITPECEPRRYDTWFFAALMPHGQEADDDTTEADKVQWVAPGDLLAAAEAGTARVLPPTIVQLRRLAHADNAATVLAQRPLVIPVMPVPTRTDDGIVMRVTLPDD
ncbi:NUDIX hydrolase [Leekyejoonella antrihumi]|uniref:NUDIX domain-containing protein n=1 Tax=Leekyejoonella antrihumi TaxID=1660198 RepID=A0A563DXB3_9MICO|nr:NUDIX hydrolase [Leekyejoonella antrihumi]TWP34324.1 NUDIX domain-containing protein [Leekyejoonella antrihumi]